MVEIQRPYHGYNMGLEMVTCYEAYFGHHESELHKKIDELELTNLQIRILSNLTSKLAHAKQKDKKFDVSNDETAKKYVYLAHLLNPCIFESKIQNLPTENLDLKQLLIAKIKELHQNGMRREEINLEAILRVVDVDPNLRFDQPFAKNESDIEILIQSADSELKMLNADLNRELMKINNKYEDRAQMTEHARQVLKESDELNKSIIQKTAR